MARVEFLGGWKEEVVVFMEGEREELGGMSGSSCST